MWECGNVCVCVSPAIPGPAGAPDQPPAPTHIHIIAGPHVVGDDELGGEFGHETRRPVFPHHEDVLLGVRGEPGEVFNFLLGGQASRGVCGHSGAERRQPRGPEPLPLILTPPATPEPAGVSSLPRLGVPVATEQVGGMWQRCGTGAVTAPSLCQRQRLPGRDRAPCRDSPPRYSRKMSSSPGRRPPAILPARSRRGRGCCSCSSERSAPEKRKKKKIKNTMVERKAGHLLSQEPHRLQKHSAAEWRGGGGTGKVRGCSGCAGRRADAGGADGALTPRDGTYAQPGGEERRWNFPPSGAAGAPPHPPRSCRESPQGPQVSRRAAGAERGSPRALPSRTGPPRPGVAPPVPAGEAGGMEEGMPIPVLAAHGASLISVKANSCSAC